MPKLSPQAQAVLDAYRSSHLSINNLAAALRAAADQVVPGAPNMDERLVAIRYRLCSIADEFEGIKHGTYRCELKEFNSSDRVA
jgi:hypothetical protein